MSTLDQAKLLAHGLKMYTQNLLWDWKRFTWVYEIHVRERNMQKWTVVSSTSKLREHLNWMKAYGADICSIYVPKPEKKKTSNS